MLKRVLVLLVLIAAPALAATPSNFKVVVWFRTAGGLKPMGYHLKEPSARSLEGNPRKTAELVDKARGDFAEKLGYSRRLFGQDNWKLAGPMVVAAVTLYNPAGRQTQLSMR